MELQIKVDKTGFPLVYVEPLGAYINWLPITKIQMEYFICSTKLPNYTEEWYSIIREYNDRVSPGVVNANNYWQSLVTGILPREARDFAQWVGKEYDLLTQEQWQEVYQYFKRELANPDHVDQLVKKDLNKRAKILLKNVDHSLRESKIDLRGGLTIADQMLMRLGVMEYVYLDDRRSTFGGFGQTNSVFFGSLLTPDTKFPERLSNPEEGTRMRHYGFRLIARNGS